MESFVKETKVKETKETKETKVKEIKEIEVEIEVEIEDKPLTAKELREKRIQYFSKKN